jgi:hypothetical protein
MKITAHFEDHKNVIEEELKKARKEVLVAVAWINFELYYDVFNLLLDRNIKLNIICTDNPSNRNYLNIIDNLKEKGALIKLLQMPSTNSHMHHKFAVIDGLTILNGSFNWSINAAKSFENLTVIENCSSTEIKKFVREFEAILKIEKETIKRLQKFSRCKNCIDGELLNVLVFSEHSTEYSETYGDVICVCNNCLEFKKIEECVQDNQIYILVNELSGASDDFEYDQTEEYLYQHLASHSDLDIHAIGKVKSTVDWQDIDDVETRILWKNKFVGDRLPNSLDHDFEVYYDN